MSRWVRYTTAQGVAGFGTIEGERINEYAGDLFGAARATGNTHVSQRVSLAAPCVPTKVVALWNNFRALGEKLGKAPPTHPLFLIKPATSVIGSAQPIRRPARYAGKIAFEGELGIVIGRTCANATLEEAQQSIFGYTCVNDVTAGELLNEDPNFPQWTRSKGFDTFCCLGPSITTGFDWAEARVVTTVDGVERQNYPLADMIFAPDQIVARISGDMTLYAGDVIACGTSIGVGSIKDGATVCIAIDGIGALSNRLEAAG